MRTGAHRAVAVAPVMAHGGDLRVSLDVTAFPPTGGVGHFALDLRRPSGPRRRGSPCEPARRRRPLERRGAGRRSAGAGPDSPSPPPGLGAGRACPDCSTGPGSSPPQPPLHDARTGPASPCGDHPRPTYFDHPEWHERSKVPVFRRAIRVASQKATVLLCDSDRTAARLDDLCAPKGRVVVVPLGVDLTRFRPSGSGPGEDRGESPGEDRGESPGEDRGEGHGPGEGRGGAADDARLLRAVGVEGPYVLFLGTLEPRKAVPEIGGCLRPGGGEPSRTAAGTGRPAGLGG